MRVLVAMSGGVDSSVAAALLQREGHEVVGVTMRLWGGDSDTGCCSVADVDDARRVAQQLGIDHLVFNFTDDFDARVVAPYVHDHAAGRTPNPCVECNRHLKFARLTERADLLGFDAVATGHHARIVRAGDEWRIARGADAAKDQSYVVHMLDQAALARTLFPVGDRTKAEVRALAADLCLRTADKPDSQDVCFITAKGRAAFLGARIPLRAAVVVDADGAPMGAVDAVELVTVGQRRGIEGTGGSGDRRYVVDVDVAGARVTLGHADDLLVGETAVHTPTWSAAPAVGPVLVQTSAHGATAHATAAAATDGRLALRWHARHRRVAPGQSVVLYDATDTYVLGGGIAS